MFEQCQIADVYRSYIVSYTNLTALGNMRDPLVAKAVDDKIRSSKLPVDDAVAGKTPLESFFAAPITRITRYFQAIAQLAVMLESASPLEAQRLHQVASTWNDLSTIANHAYVSAEVERWHCIHS